MATVVVGVDNTRLRSPIGLRPASVVALGGGKRLHGVEGVVTAERCGWWQNQRQGTAHGHGISRSWRLGGGQDGGGRLSRAQQHQSIAMRWLEVVSVATLGSDWDEGVENVGVPNLSFFVLHSRGVFQPPSSTPCLQNKCSELELNYTKYVDTR